MDEGARDLLAEALLQGEPAGEDPYEPRQLRDADDPLASDVADVRDAVERERVVLAEGAERDRPLDDLGEHRLRPVGRLRRERRQQLRIALVARSRVVERAQEA